MTNDTLQDFQDHQFSYDRAHQIGLFERTTAEEMKELYSENRTESYYGGGRPTEEQAEAMTEPACWRAHLASAPQNTGSSNGTRQHPQVYNSRAMLHEWSETESTYT